MSAGGMRRIQKVVVAVLGAVAAGLVVWLAISASGVHLFGKGGVDVEGLIAELKSPNAAEARAAFDRLAEIPDDSLDLLVPFVTSREPTSLNSISWQGNSIRRPRNASNFLVGDIAQIVLRFRTSDQGALILGGSAEDRWRAKLAEYRRKDR